MTTPHESRDGPGLSHPAATALWVTLIAALTVGGSLLLACVAPFAAIAALAAAKMDRWSGLALVVVAWVANQAVGFGLLDYPHTASTVAWGVAIGLATVAGFLSARVVVMAGKSPAVTLPVTLPAALLTAFAVYEAALYATGLWLGASDTAFSFDVVRDILAINAVSFAGLLALHRIAVALAWVSSPGQAEAHA